MIESADATCCLEGGAMPGNSQRFQQQVIDTDFVGDYGVKTVDVNGGKK